MNLFPADAELTSYPEPPTDQESYRHRRSLWPAGPWHLEQFDKVHWIDPATDMDCLMVRNAMGAWCGYVAVTEGHPAFGKSYNDVDPHPRVHGGLTFSDSCHEGGKICHEPQPGRPNK